MQRTPGAERQEREANHQPLSGVEVSNDWMYNSIHTLCLHGVNMGNFAISGFTNSFVYYVKFLFSSRHNNLDPNITVRHSTHFYFPLLCSTSPIHRTCWNHFHGLYKHHIRDPFFTSFLHVSSSLQHVTLRNNRNRNETKKKKGEAENIFVACVLLSSCLVVLPLRHRSSHNFIKV
jgi:hypothetical protein